MVSFEPVPLETTLLNWSSRVTPRPTVPPAVMEPAGGVLMTSCEGAKAETVKELDVAAVIECGGVGRRDGEANPPC